MAINRKRLSVECKVYPGIVGMCQCGNEECRARYRGMHVVRLMEEVEDGDSVTIVSTPKLYAPGHCPVCDGEKGTATNESRNQSIAG